MKGSFLAVWDGLRNETFACSEKNELIKIDGQGLSVYFTFVFIILLTRLIFLFFFFFWVRSRAFNNHFPDL